MDVHSCVKLYNISDLHNFLLLYLDYTAFAIYDKLSQKVKPDETKTKNIQLNVFALDSFCAYDTFAVRRGCRASL